MRRLLFSDIVLRRAYREWRTNGHVAVLIVGGHGYGKTSFAMQLMHKFYRMLYKKGCRCVENTILHPKALFDFLMRERRVPAILLDDIENIFNSLSRDKRTVTFLKVMNYIRDYAAFCIMTAPRSRIVTKDLRTKADFAVKLIRKEEGYTLARAYRYVETIQGAEFYRRLGPPFRIKRVMPHYSEFLQLRKEVREFNREEMRRVWEEYSVLEEKREALKAAKKYIKVSELADVLGVTPQAIYDKIKRGELPAKRFGKRVLIPIEVLEQFT